MLLIRCEEIKNVPFHLKQDAELARYHLNLRKNDISAHSCPHNVGKTLHADDFTYRARGRPSKIACRSAHTFHRSLFAADPSTPSRRCRWDIILYITLYHAELEMSSENFRRCKSFDHAVSNLKIPYSTFSRSDCKKIKKCICDFMLKTVDKI